MTRTRRAALAALLAIGPVLAVSSPAAARTTGHETFAGVLVASGASGTRTVVASAIAASGLFNGVGRIVEIPNRPGDADNVSRDDLVFAGGTMHIVNTGLDASFSLDPRTCVFSVAVQQSVTAAGGTGVFAAATGTFAGSATAHGIAQRDPDGSCSQQQAPLSEVDVVQFAGQMSL